MEALQGGHVHLCVRHSEQDAITKFAAASTCDGSAMALVCTSTIRQAHFNMAVDSNRVVSGFLLPAPGVDVGLLQPPEAARCRWVLIHVIAAKPVVT